MNSLRKVGYAALLAASIFNLAPTLVAAEEPARGKFILTHDVRWETATVPAGEYEFAFDPDNVSPVMTITKVSGARASFMLMVPTREESKSHDSNRLLLESTPEGSYVSAMELPECGVTLRFRVPHPSEKLMAKVASASAGSGK
jgi:hypothetical protein